MSDIKTTVDTVKQKAEELSESVKSLNESTDRLAGISQSLLDITSGFIKL